jgi:hypothetical protein
MNKTQRFTIWLKGFLDATGPNPTTDQVKTIKETLNIIFEHAIKKEEINEKEDYNEFSVNDITGNDISSGMFPSENDVVYRC